ncbi:hypothetical protein FIBSPDRAFT_859042 [Athelia psychrophila]|uniref:Uncharacterized protein n=1 Tax=Athelia psychrophila TaxID=1759441 RepID=A0A166LLQ2_9AGAM|nr:hypothetical protein FIBSPDRAFT_859042 [Fibularhizoctonia sp. CBS 109695]
MFGITKKLQDMSQDLYPVLSHSQNCLSLEFTSSNWLKSPTYKAFQTSGAPGLASTLSAGLVICTPLPSKIHWTPSTSYALRSFKLNFGSLSHCHTQRTLALLTREANENRPPAFTQ